MFVWSNIPVVPVPFHTLALTFLFLWHWFCRLSSFNALMLLVWWHKGHPACKNSETTISKRLLFGTGLTWSNLTWNNSKNGPVKQKLSMFIVLQTMCPLLTSTLQNYSLIVYMTLYHSTFPLRFKVFKVLIQFSRSCFFVRVSFLICFFLSWYCVNCANWLH